MSDFDHPVFGRMPERIFADRDVETNEKRWYSTPGMGEPYVRVDTNYRKLAEVETLRAEITKLKSQLEEARAKAISDCIAKVQQMHDGFLSPEYATGQPVSSITERITCRMIQDQLCALLHDGGKARSVLDAHKEGGKP